MGCMIFSAPNGVHLGGSNWCIGSLRSSSTILDTLSDFKLASAKIMSWSQFGKDGGARNRGWSESDWSNTNSLAPRNFSGRKKGFCHLVSRLAYIFGVY